MADVITTPEATEVKVTVDGPTRVVTPTETPSLVETPAAPYGVVTVVPLPVSVKTDGDAPVEVVTVLAGPPGAPGPPGPPGPAGGARYSYAQLIAAPVWDIGHGLEAYPSVTVTTLDGEKVDATVQYVDSTNVQLTFSEPFAGYAYLN